MLSMRGLVCQASHIPMVSKQLKPNRLPPTSRSLPISLIRAREGIMSPIRDMLAESGITEQQWRVLRVLAEHGPQSTSAVAELACLLLPSLTRIAQKMQDKGLIKLSRDDTDRRRQTISITPAGQQIIDDNVLHAADIVRGFKHRLGAEKYEQLLDLLALLDPHNKD